MKNIRVFLSENFQFLEVKFSIHLNRRVFVMYSPDKLSDHDIVSGFFRIFIPHTKKPRRQVYSYQKVTLKV